MVSLDTPEKNKEFADGLDAKHVLLSDPTGEAARAYGVAGFGGLFAKRWTFYIDKDGKVAAIDKAVKPPTSAEDMIARLEELKVAKAQ